jgi:hypothetical protein
MLFNEIPLDGIICESSLYKNILDLEVTVKDFIAKHENNMYERVSLI